MSWGRATAGEVLELYKALETSYREKGNPDLQCGSEHLWSQHLKEAEAGGLSQLEATLVYTQLQGSQDYFKEQ